MHYYINGIYNIENFNKGNLRIPTFDDEAIKQVSIRRGTANINQTNIDETTGGITKNVDREENIDIQKDTKSYSSELEIKDVETETTLEVSQEIKQEKRSSFKQSITGFTSTRTSKINPNGVVLCNVCGFEGCLDTLLPGNYPDLTRNGIEITGNNAISSLNVPKGMVLKIYSKINYEGETYEIEGPNSLSCLTHLNWDNKIASCKIISNDNTAIFSQHCNFEGYKETLNIGDYPDLGDVYMKDNDLSAIKLGKNIRVKVYDGKNFTGQNKTFEGPKTINCLVSIGWNDRIKSIKIENKLSGYINKSDSEWIRLFDKSPNKIIKRECQDCSGAHKTIFYRRITSTKKLKPDPPNTKRSNLRYGSQYLKPNGNPVILSNGGFQWDIVVGLWYGSKTNRYVSFKNPSKNSYIRHAGYVCHDHNYSTVPLYLKDATFIYHRHGNGYKFQSVNYPHLYLGLQGNRLKIVPGGLVWTLDNNAFIDIGLVTNKPQNYSCTSQKDFIGGNYHQNSIPGGANMNWDQMKNHCKTQSDQKGNDRFWFQKHPTGYSICGFPSNNNKNAAVFHNHKLGGVCDKTIQEVNADNQNINGETISMKDLFLLNWFSKGNKINVDFELYSNYNDAKKRRNKWRFCNYDDPGVGFPRDCGPNGYKAYQWHSVNGRHANNAAQKVQYSIEEENNKFTVLYQTPHFYIESSDKGGQIKNQESKTTTSLDFDQLDVQQGPTSVQRTDDGININVNNNGVNVNVDLDIDLGSNGLPGENSWYYIKNRKEGENKFLWSGRIYNCMIGNKGCGKDLTDEGGAKYNALNFLFDQNNKNPKCILKTTNNYSYKKLGSILNEDHVFISVLANNDAHIALGETTGHNDKHYEIVLGGWGNNKSVIRSQNQGSNLVEVNEKIFGDGMRNGLTYEYYDVINRNGTFSNTPFKTEIVNNTINYWWNTGNVGTSGKRDYVGLKIKGFIKSPDDGYYKFKVRTDDGFVLYIDNKPVINSYILQAPTWRESGPIKLERNKFYKFEIKWYEWGGHAVMELYWMRPNNRWEVIPRNFFYLFALEPKKFWISWKNNLLKVGKGFELNKNELMSLDVKEFNYNIKYLLVSTGWGSNGEWELFSNFCDNKILSKEQADELCNNPCYYYGKQGRGKERQSFIDSNMCDCSKGDDPFGCNEKDEKCAKSINFDLNPNDTNSFETTFFESNTTKKSKTREYSIKMEEENKSTSERITSSSSSSITIDLDPNTEIIPPNLWKKKKSIDPLYFNDNELKIAEQDANNKLQLQGGPIRIDNLVTKLNDEDVPIQENQIQPELSDADKILLGIPLDNSNNDYLKTPDDEITPTDRQDLISSRDQQRQQIETENKYQFDKQNSIDPNNSSNNISKYSNYIIISIVAIFIFFIFFR